MKAKISEMKSELIEERKKGDETIILRMNNE